MVVNTRGRTRNPVSDLGYLALFLGLRINELVRENMRAAGFRDVRDSHGYVIQHLIEAERSVTQLAARMEVTQQAASKMVAELAALEILEVIPGEDRRVKRIRLTARGWEAVQVGRRLRRKIERKLARVAGAKQYEAARVFLSACLEALGGMEKVRSRRVSPPG